MTYPLIIGTWEIVIICFVILLLFGGKKLPELMKGIGQGVSSFKKGLDEVEEEINKAADEPVTEVKEPHNHKVKQRISPQ